MSETSAELLTAVLTRSDCLLVTKSGELSIEACRATELVARLGSPLFVMSDAVLRDNYRRIRRAFEEEWPGPVNVMYAIKCNPNFAVRAVLHQEGAGGDCFGLGELEATFAGGANPEKIALNGSSKSDAVITRAVELGVAINMDAEDEIEQIDRIASSLDQTVRVNIRLKVIPDSYADYQSDLIEFSGDFRRDLQRLKWGVSAETAEGMVREISRRPRLELLGYHSHLGRMSQKVEHRAAYDGEIGRVVAALYRATGFTPSVIDIGGGWPRERDPESKSQERNPNLIEDYARATSAALKAPLDAAGMPTPALWLEPGRYIAGNAGVLLTTVGMIKQDDGMTWVNVDASTNIMPLLGAGEEGTRNQVIAATHMHEPLEVTADVVGPICIPSVLCADCRLPKLQSGDLIAILDAGMYAESDSHQLNWMPRPATVMVRGEEVGLVRTAETLESIFVTQCIPDWLRGVNYPPSKYRDMAYAADNGSESRRRET